MNGRTLNMTPPPSPEYVECMRGYLRYSGADALIDGEIADLIAAARADLALAGVLPERTSDEGDALIKRAVSVYVKAEFGLDNSDADLYKASYVQLRLALSLSSYYIGEV